MECNCFHGYVLPVRENGPQFIWILRSQFTPLLNGTSTFKAVCDNLRFMLNWEKSLQYCYGRNYTNTDELVRDLTSTK